MKIASDLNLRNMENVERLEAKMLVSFAPGSWRIQLSFEQKFPFFCQPVLENFSNEKEISKVITLLWWTFHIWF